MYTKLDTGVMAYKIELIDGEIVERELTPEEYEKESKYADEVISSFVPIKMPLQASRKPAGAFK